MNARPDDDIADGAFPLDGAIPAKPKRRKAPKAGERLSPCICCSYPVTQRHHCLNFADYGEVGPSIQLCANCHEFYHLVEMVRVPKLSDAFQNRTNRRLKALLVLMRDLPDRYSFLEQIADQKARFLLRVSAQVRKQEWIESCTGGIASGEGAE